MTACFLDGQTKAKWDLMAIGILANYAARVREMGSSFVALVLEAGERQLARAPRTAGMIARWPRNVAADAVAMRFNGALHALARSGQDPDLTALYSAQGGDFDAAIGPAMQRSDAFIADWMRHPPQTNEVGRSAALMAALMVLRGVHDMPCELLELGASAGLNLNLARYAYDLGGVAAGDEASPVRIAPHWRGEAPVSRPVDVRAARGIDLHPLDVRDVAARERLMAYIWADEPDRLDRLDAALRLARDSPPKVDRGDIAARLPVELAKAQHAGRCRVVFHSMALQYLPEPDRAGVDRNLARAGESATADRPLARIALEWTEPRDAVRLLLTSWPGGETRHLATCHAYGAWIEWHGDGALVRA